MHKVFAVIRREFIERVRTRVFILSTLLFPVFMVTIFVLPAWMMSRDTGLKRIAVVDGTTSGLGELVESSLTSARRKRGDAEVARFEVTRVRAVGRELAVRDSLVPLTGRNTETGFTGILVVGDSSLETGRVQYYGKNVGSLDDVRELGRTVEPTLISQRLESMGLDQGTVMKAVRRIDVVTAKVADGRITGESGQATFFLAYGMGMILYMALLIFGSQVMTSVVEEKSTRIVEILASSLTPFQMMLGKVVGVGSVALLQIGIWAGTASFLSANQGRIIQALGGDASATGGGFALPGMTPGLLIVFLLFFALGFLIFAALYAAVGSMVNTVQEAQQAQFPVMMFVLAGFFSVFMLIREPDGTAAQVLTYVPLLSPFVTPMRYSIAPLPWPELLGSIAATVLGLLGVVWVAARIYRVGILMYGKRASMREVARWIAAA